MTETTDEIDWYARARSTLQVTDTKHTSKLTRRTLGNICSHLADAIPLEIAAPACGITERTAYKWMEDREPIARLINEAKAGAKMRQIRKIDNDPSWKAARELLGILDPRYGGSGQTHSRGGLSITINVPIPAQVEAGQQPMIDITPDDEDTT